MRIILVKRGVSNIKAIIIAVFLTFIVPIWGIYYGKKNNQPFDIYYSIVLYIVGIWYLLLIIVGKFVEYNYAYFTLTTLIYFIVVFLVYKIIKLSLRTYRNIHSNFLSK